MQQWREVGEGGGAVVDEQEGGDEHMGHSDLRFQGKQCERLQP
jgi:hypothetical protein